MGEFTFNIFKTYCKATGIKDSVVLLKKYA